eukprot:TRINITY_DN3280_c0_g1_i11.p1 TRINITY_DN3280_c0_g1~~TRINITY_DN3280_c0_g1_i11.p1  ORF type:complete len:481 (+),score=62.97 TRINITY_DN3280_c0_g1_i11:43-1485(+)
MTATLHHRSPGQSNAAHGTSNLSDRHAESENTNAIFAASTLGRVLLLFLLYTFQGCVLGLVQMTFPMAADQFSASSPLRHHFAAVYLVYECKLIIAPLTDYLSAGHGRRKLWIAPSQIVIGIVLLYVASVGHTLFTENNLPLALLLSYFLMLLVAIHDVSLDVWAIGLFKREELYYYPACQISGNTAGYFLSTLGFQTLMSSRSCDTFLESCIMNDFELLPGYLVFIAALSIVLTLMMLLFPDPIVPSSRQSLRLVFVSILNLTKSAVVRNLLFFLLIFRSSIIFLDATNNLQIHQKGIWKDVQATFTIIEFPLHILCIGFSWYILSLSRSVTKAWGVGYGLALGINTFLARYMTSLQVPELFRMISYHLPIQVGGVQLFSYFGSVLMQLSLITLYSRNLDPQIASSQIALFNTAANLGGFWPAWLATHGLSFSKYQTWLHFFVIRSGFSLLPFSHISVEHYKRINDRFFIGCRTLTLME